MAKITLNTESFKAAGVYTVEIDNTTRTTVDTNALRLLVGFNTKGPFNKPVFLRTDSQRQQVFGSIDRKLEQKGCFFNRFAQTMLRKGPIFALNLLKVDERENGPDQVNFAAMSLDAGGSANPNVSPAKAYGEYDFLTQNEDSLDCVVYGSDKGANIPYVGNVAYASLFDRSRFWTPNSDNLTAIAANKLSTGDDSTFEHTNFLNFANTGTDEISILVFKPENFKGFDITASEWYGGAENIPYGWIRPSDLISEYFLTVVCVKGNWSNYPALSVDPLWYSYFDARGILKNKVSMFLGAEGITPLGSWTGCIIPEFTDKQGANQYLISKINAVTETTGLLAAFNEDAAQVLNYDLNGAEYASGEQEGQGCWFFDIDGDSELNGEAGESLTNQFLIDMVGHNFQHGYKLNDKPVEVGGVGAKTNGGDWDQSVEQANGTQRIYLPTIEETSFEGASNSYNKVLEFRDENNAKNNKYKLNLVAKCSGIKEDNNFEVALALIDNATGKSVKFDADGSTALEPKMQITKASYVGTEIRDILNSPTAGVENPATGLYTVSYLDYIPESGAKIRFKVALQIMETIEQLKAPIASNAGKEIGGKFYDAEGYELDKENGARVTENVNTPHIFYAEFDEQFGLVKEYSKKYSSPFGMYIEISKEANALGDTLAINKDSLYMLKKETVKSGKTEKIVESFAQISNSVNATGVRKGEEYFVTFNYGELQYVLRYSAIDAVKPVEIVLQKLTNERLSQYGIHFLSYNYEAGKETDETSKEVLYNSIVKPINNAYYFNNFGRAKGEEIFDENPVDIDVLNCFIVTSDEDAKKITIGDYINNIAFENENGVAAKYSLIPGITKVTNKVFINLNANNTFNYKGNTYLLKIDNLDVKKVIENKNFNTRGFYLVTTIDPVDIRPANNMEAESIQIYAADGETLIDVYPIYDDAHTQDDSILIHDDKIVGWEVADGRDVYYKVANKEDEDAMEIGRTFTGIVKPYDECVIANTNFNGKTNLNEFTERHHMLMSVSSTIRQKPITDDEVSTSLRFIPMKGLKITSRHKPGYDADGNVSLEAGVEKIYSVLEDAGVGRGLTNPEMIDYRYIVDSMGYGLTEECGGKRYLSRLAQSKGSTTALLNMPSMKQFATSQNPYFCDEYLPGIEVKPAFDTKYVPLGGNDKLYSTNLFTLPTEDDGAKFTGCFWPYLQYNDNGKKTLVPPAADVANAFITKFQGGDPWGIIANLKGIIDNPKVVGVEYMADTTDREYLEPFGINAIIQRRGQVMIYGNQTAFQKVKSDFNKLQTREVLNSLEIECHRISEDYVFDLNTPTTRASLVTAVTPIFEAARLAGALNNYEIICDESNNTSDIIEADIMVVDYGVEVNHGCEKIVQRFTVNRHGSMGDSNN